MNSITDLISPVTQCRPMVLFKKSQSATDENVKLYTLSHLKHVDSTKFQNIDDSAIPTSGGIENAWSIEFFTISNSDRSKCEIALFAFVEQIFIKVSWQKSVTSNCPYLYSLYCDNSYKLHFMSASSKDLLIVKNR